MKSRKKFSWLKLKSFGLGLLFAVLLTGSIVSYIRDKSIINSSVKYSAYDNTVQSLSYVEPYESSESDSETEISDDTVTENTEITVTKINLNTATSEELQTVKGIGPSKSAAIIQYREEYGAFVSVDELIEVSGIGEKTLEKIRDYFTVE